MIVEEGLEHNFARLRANSEALWQGLEEMDLPPFIPLEYRLPPLTTAQVPAGVDPHQIRTRLLNEYNIEIAAGFGALKDKVWRIGLMGYSSRKENVTAFGSTEGIIEITRWFHPFLLLSSLLFRAPLRSTQPTEDKSLGVLIIDDNLNPIDHKQILDLRPLAGVLYHLL